MLRILGCVWDVLHALEYWNTPLSHSINLALLLFLFFHTSCMIMKHCAKNYFDCWLDTCPQISNSRLGHTVWYHTGHVWYHIIPGYFVCWDAWFFLFIFFIQQISMKQYFCWNIKLLHVSACLIWINCFCKLAKIFFIKCFLIFCSIYFLIYLMNEFYMLCFYIAKIFFIKWYIHIQYILCYLLY